MTVRERLKHMNARLPDVLASIDREMSIAYFHFDTFHSAHEGYAVLLEEMDELKAEVWKRQDKRVLRKMRKEALHVAAMAVRFIIDVCHEGGADGE